MTMAARRRDRWLTLYPSRAMLESALVLVLMVRAGPVGADEKAPGDRSTGIELAWKTSRMTAPIWWEVIDAASGRRVTRVEQRWGFAHVPPGAYRVEAQLGEARGTSREIFVRPGDLPKKLTPSDLGLGQLIIELPAAQGIFMIPGVARLDAQFEQGDRRQALNPKEAGSRQVTIWAHEGQATIRFQGGTVLLDEPANVVHGATRHVPFDAEALAAKLRLRLISIVIRDPAGSVATRDTQVAFHDPRGEHLLVVTPDPPPGTTWLVPPGAVVRVRHGGREQVRRNLPTGPRSDLVFDFAPPPQDKGPVKIAVDVHIESPEKSAVVKEERVTVIGRASASGPAGPTRIALVIDVSMSTSETSGADLDGDGKSENIFQAEVMASRLLLDALAAVESRSPGSAFEMTILTFAGGVKVMTPLTKMGERSGVATLRKAMDRVVEDGQRGGTVYQPPLKAAVKELRSSGRPGRDVILMMSDGEPDDIPASLDVAGRAGLEGVTIHTFGLGQAFASAAKRGFTFPPLPTAGAEILGGVAAAGAGGGTFTPLPRPAGVVQVIPHLPVLELPAADIQEVQVVNETTGRPALSVQLSRDGAFQADVPVSLMPRADEETNTLVATAVARDGVSKATDRVWVQGPPQPSSLALTYRRGEQAPPLPTRLLPSLEIILDSSHSMQEKVDGKPKSQVAHAVVAELIETLPDTMQVGLRLFGHFSFWPPTRSRFSNPSPDDPRRKTDSKLEVPIRLMTAQQRAHLKAGLKRAQSRGDTPLVYSLIQARDDFAAGWKAAKSVVLISDGKETCGGKLEDVARAYKGAAIAVVIHVVGFDIRDNDERRQLMEIAKLGGGQYFDAANAEELAASLRKAVESANYVVRDEAGKSEVARGLINGSPLTLMPGSYRVRVIGDEENSLLIRLRNRQKLEIALDPSGRLVAPKESATVGTTTPVAGAEKSPSGNRPQPRR
jgi:hypothetical protein